MNTSAKPVEWSDEAVEAICEVQKDAHRDCGDCCGAANLISSLDDAAAAQFAPPEEQEAFREVIEDAISRYIDGDQLPGGRWANDADKKIATLRAALASGVVVARRKP